MAGQGTIVATGAIQSAGARRTMTLTSTYDHRIIQGAESGVFLRAVDRLLQGADGFYESVAASLGVPATALAPLPAPGAARGARRRGAAPRRGRAAGRLGRRDGGRRHRDVHREGVPHPRPPRRAARPARHAAQGRPRARSRRRRPQRRDDARHPGLHPPRRHAGHHLRRRAAAPARDLLRHHRVREGAHQRPRGAGLAAPRRRVGLEPPAARAPRRSSRCCAASPRSRRWSASSGRAYLGQKRFSIEGVDVLVPMLDLVAELAAEAGTREVVIGMAHRGRLNVLAHVVGHAVRDDPRGVRGRQGRRERARTRRRHRRREVPPRRAGRPRDALGQAGAVHAVAQPEPPRGGEPGGRGADAGHPDAPHGPRAHHDVSVALPVLDPRRRRVRGAGRRGGDAQPGAARGLRDRRDAPHHHQQPGGLHHRAERGPLHRLRVRPRQGLRPSRSSTSTPTIPRRASRPCGWRWTTGRASTATC